MSTLSRCRAFRILALIVLVAFALIGLATTPAIAANPSKAAPVIRASAVLHTPIRSTLAGGQQISVDLAYRGHPADQLSIRRVAGEDGHVTFEVYIMSETEDAIAYRSVTGVKAGDLIEVELALEQTEAGADPLRQMATRVKDLRTGKTTTFGPPSLLVGSPDPPIALARRSGHDVAVTTAKWAQGWPRSFAGLASEADRQPSGRLIGEGVAQRSTDFFITDAAHRHAVPLGTVRLLALHGDSVTVTAMTAPTGRRTSVTITDARSRRTVTSAG